MFPAEKLFFVYKITFRISRFESFQQYILALSDTGPLYLHRFWIPLLMVNVLAILIGDYPKSWILGFQLSKPSSMPRKHGPFQV